jgi:MFS transporter, putative metabolite:H+ symporter
MTLLTQKKNASFLILVAALGYFVDIYDLVLFGMERVASLKDILGHTLPEAEKANMAKYVEKIGIQLINWQMFGMLVGGIFWGILGDKKGRLSVLFGSIIMYSIANILNGMVTDTDTYSILRFVSGFGLAGELGAGITLVSEVMPKEKRGIGTTIVASVGLFGAVVAGLTTMYLDNWRLSYYIGGGMGLLLLLLRIGVYESGMYDNVKKDTSVKKGNFFQLFSSVGNMRKYLSVIFIAVPVWYVMFLLIQLAPEMCKAMGMAEPPKDARMSIMMAYIGITIGDVASGLLSQYLKSRKKVLAIFISLTLIFSVVYFLFAAKSLFMFYTIVLLIGFSTGYWAVFMSAASELFGTNIRATVTTTAPNFVRGSVLLMTPLYQILKGYLQSISAAIIVGVFVFAIAYWALYKLDETFTKDLDYVE